jgi:hypothetical protein
VVEVRVKDDQMGYGFRRKIQLVQLFEKGIGNSTDSSFNDGTSFSSDKVEVEVFRSQKGNIFSQLEWLNHRFKLTHP